MGTMLVQALQADSSVDPKSLDNFTEALASAQRNRIDILGAYANLYHPIVFSSLQKPIRNQWLDSTSAQMRTAFWSSRRGRPLADFVPVSRTWLQSAITGWLIGRLTGEVVLPGEGTVTDGGVAVWSDEHRAFTRLPHPLLGVENTARDAPGWGLVAAVAESLPLAVALCDGDAEFVALRPYQSLFELGRHLQDPNGHQEIGALRTWVGTGVGRGGLPPRGQRGTETTAGGATHGRQGMDHLGAAGRRQAVAARTRRSPVSEARSARSRRTTSGRFRAVWELAPQLFTAAQQLLDHLAHVDYAGTQQVGEADGGISAAL